MIHLVSLPEDVIGNETVRTQLDALLAARPELTAAITVIREDNATSDRSCSSGRSRRWPA